MADQSGDEPAAMKVLRQRLKLDTRTKPGMLAVAAALARESSLDPATVLKSVPPGSHGRAKALAARIASLPAVNEPSRWLPGDELLLRPEWIKANAPALLSIWTGSLAFSTDGLRATRAVRVHISGCDDETRADEVVYDLTLRDGETQKNRDDKHRCRESACIRRLDAAAADAYQARRVQEQRSRRADEAAVREVLWRTWS